MYHYCVGYRHVHLHTPTWEKIEHATVFMHVTIHEAHHFSIKVCVCVCVCVICVCTCVYVRNMHMHVCIYLYMHTIYVVLF